MCSHVADRIIESRRNRMTLYKNNFKILLTIFTLLLILKLVNTYQRAGTVTDTCWLRTVQRKRISWPRWYRRTVEWLAARRRWREDGEDLKMSAAEAMCTAVYQHPHQLLRSHHQRPRRLLYPSLPCRYPRHPSDGKISMLYRRIKSKRRCVNHMTNFAAVSPTEKNIYKAINTRI